MLNWYSKYLYDSPLAKYFNIKQHFSFGTILSPVLLAYFFSDSYNMLTNIR